MKPSLHSTGDASRLNCVARHSHIGNMLAPRALYRPDAAIDTAALGATRAFHHGLLAPRVHLMKNSLHLHAAPAVVRPIAVAAGCPAHDIILAVLIRPMRAVDRLDRPSPGTHLPGHSRSNSRGNRRAGPRRLHRQSRIQRDGHEVHARESRSSCVGCSVRARRSKVRSRARSLSLCSRATNDRPSSGPMGESSGRTPVQSTPRLSGGCITGIPQYSRAPPCSRCDAESYHGLLGYWCRASQARRRAASWAADGSSSAW